MSTLHIVLLILGVLLFFAAGGVGLDISGSVSSSATAASRAGEGDFYVVGGGTKSAQTMWYVLGVVALVGLWLWLRRRK